VVGRVGCAGEASRKQLCLVEGKGPPSRPSIGRAGVGMSHTPPHTRKRSIETSATKTQQHATHRLPCRIQLVRERCVGFSQYFNCSRRVYVSYLHILTYSHRLHPMSYLFKDWIAYQAPGSSPKVLRQHEVFLLKNPSSNLWDVPSRCCEQS
jgi:hypothetical protein